MSELSEHTLPGLLVAPFPEASRHEVIISRLRKPDMLLAVEHTIVRCLQSVKMAARTVRPSEESEAGQEALVVCSYKYPALAALPSDHVGKLQVQSLIIALQHYTRLVWLSTQYGTLVMLNR